MFHGSARVSSHIPTGANPENETCVRTESSDLKLCPQKNSLRTATAPETRPGKTRKKPGKNQEKTREPKSTKELKKYNAPDNMNG
ncbi:hypothetical protein MSMTP_1971 [Methanosarcina sp. MTP4]|nr:hypothetical protein MSMTP_1971 [Methanosarcina sp. MTP4]